MEQGHRILVGRSLAILGLVIAASLITSPAPADSKTEKPTLLPTEWFYGKPDQRARQDALVGQPMPVLDLTEWLVQELKPKDLKGKIVVIDFWATWCRPCLMAVPHNNELAEKYKDQGVTFLGVCTSRMGQDRMKQVAESAKVKYPQGRDALSKSEAAWQVQWYPTYAIVDRQGIVRGVGLLPQFVEPAIQKLWDESGRKKK